MQPILVTIEARDGKVAGSSLELLAAARVLAGGEPVVEALVAATDPAALAGQLGGADRIVTVAHAAAEPYTPEAHVAILAHAIAERRPDIVLASYSAAGLDLAAGAAARCDLPLVAYCIGLARAEGGVEAVSRILGGKVQATTRTPLPAVFAVTPGSFRGEDGQAGGRGEIVALAPPAGLDALRTRFVAATRPDPGAVDLTQAERIVCVGRGIGEKDKIAEAEEVAGLLAAEIAGSRPVIDAGWLPKVRQVGKSGTTVKPRLYLAVGVSGAPEHLEGMGQAAFIVAVNTDAKAPIFGAAHLGTTCDLHELLPALAARLQGQGA